MNFSKRKTRQWGMERHSTSPQCGNLVDGLPHDCHTETIGKLARLGPAKNDELVTEFGGVDKILLDELYEYARKPCRAYVEDQYECDKM